MKKLLLGCLTIMTISGVAAASGVCVNTVIDITMTPSVSANLRSNTAHSAFIAPLGQSTVQSGDPAQQVAPRIYTSGPVQILESINAGDGGSLSALYERFGDLSAVPEPITFVLLGSALAFLGIVGRRLRKD